MVPEGADVVTWPQVESLVFGCHLRAALCLLHLGRSKEAVDVCDTALAMPCVNGSDELPMLLGYKLRGLVDIVQATPRTRDFRRGV